MRARGEMQQYSTVVAHISGDGMAAILPAGVDLTFHLHDRFRVPGRMEYPSGPASFHPTWVKES